MIWTAQLDDAGNIIPGPWIVPGLGKSRFTTREKAEARANFISTFYGPDVWGAKVEEEESRSAPGTIVFQVYIRSLGAIEGLVRR